MPKNYILFILLFFCLDKIQGQDLSYTCPRDTVLGCNNPCISLNATIPDIRSLSSDYIVTNVSSVFHCRPYVDPGGAGFSANINNNDVYSAIINIPFNFAFYGKIHNKLVISTNGVVSFDISKAGGFAHFGSASGDLPNSFYDRAIIMGLYHDLDIRELISPNRKIKYNVIGNAPNRKWILSFYKIPLFYNGNGCNLLFENTHQIILHESSGIVEVQVLSRQPCTAWQDGRGMIGMQDSFKLNGIVAPQRGATSPLWGNINMNETWRFIPRNGPPLYRSVQLLDATGTVVATGDTTRINPFTFGVTFSNVCPPATGTNMYVVKTTYQRIDDPSTNFYSLDTIRVIRQQALALSATASATNCVTAAGSITATAYGGTGQIQYSLNNGTTLQASNIFNNLPAGNYNVYAVDATGCFNTVSASITNISNLTGTYVTTPSSCATASNGTVTVTPASGAAPYSFVLDNNPLTQQSGGYFQNLSPGAHTIVFTDSNNCTGTVSFNTSYLNQLSFNSLTSSTSCPDVNNGSITVTPTSGTGPYTYGIGQPPVFQVNNTFTGIPPGLNYITLRDAIGCTGERNVFVGAGASLAGSISTTATSCAGNDGTVSISMTNGSAPYTATLTNTATGQVITQVLNTGTGIINNLSAGIYDLEIRDANNCKRNSNAAVNSNSGITGTATFTPASCPGVNNGTITVIPAGGSVPYLFSLDGGPPQPSNIFNGVSAGLHNISFTDAGGCTGNTSVTVGAGSSISVTALPTATSCNNLADGSITINTAGGTGPFTYSLDGGAPQTSNIFSGVSAGPHTISLTDNNGCTGSTTTTVDQGPPLTAQATPASTSCSTAGDGSITINPGTGTAPYTYSMTGGPTQLINQFTSLATGLYSFTFTDVNGCSGTATAIVSAGPVITGISASTPASCLGATDGSINITPSLAGTYDFSLTGGSMNIQNTTGIFNNLSAGNNYSVTFSNAAGCSFTLNNISINDGSPLTANTLVTSATCPTSSNGTIEVTPSGGTGPYSFTLNPGNITQSGATSTLFTGLAPGPYTINISSNNGCTGSVTPNPQVASGPPLTDNTTKTDPPCYRINDGTISITPVGGQGPFAFTLNPGNIVQTGASSTTFSGLSAITYNYSYTDAVGCQGSGSQTLMTNLPLASTSSYTMPLCNGDANGSIGMNPTGGVSPYSYSIDGGTNYQSANVISGLAAGSYTVRIRDNVNCIKDTILSLSEPTLLTASTDTIASTCVGNDGTITITASGGTPAYTYSINNGTAYQNSNIFIVPDGNFGNILVKDANNCIVQTSAVVTRIDNMFLNIFPEDTTICAERSVVLRPETNAATSVFNWSSPDAAPGTINNPNIKNPTVSPVDTAQYILQAFLGVCERKDTLKINVLHKPIPDAGADSSICFDKRLIFLSGNSSDASGPVSYAWSPAADLYNPNDQNTFGEIGQSTTFTLTVTDNYGCNFLVTDQVTINKQPPVPAFAGKDTIAVKGQPHQLQASGGSGYLWTPAAVLNDPATDHPVAILQNDTRFTVLVSDPAGCTGSDTVFVKVYDGPAYYVPNAFSPNGDGLNDVFRAVPVGMTTTEFFRVFNRLGEIIFETNKWMQGWDGTFRGQPQPKGTYVWVVHGKDRDGKKVEAKGTVVLIR